MSDQPDKQPDFSHLADLYFYRGLIPGDITAAGFRYKKGYNFITLKRRLESQISQPPFMAGAREAKAREVLKEMLEPDA